MADMVDNMKAIPQPGGVGAYAQSPAPVGASWQNPSTVAPGTTAAVPRYSMGSTGSVTDNSLSGPTISQGGPYTMPGGEASQAQNQMNQQQQSANGYAQQAGPQASNALSGGPSISSFYGR